MVHNINMQHSWKNMDDFLKVNIHFSSIVCDYVDKSFILIYGCLLRIHDTFTSKNNSERGMRSLLALYFDT